MALSTQPNGSTIVPVAGAPLIPGASTTVTAQTQSTLVINANGGTESETIKVIQS
jgi:hypothetical protein